MLDRIFKFPLPDYDDIYDTYKEINQKCFFIASDHKVKRGLVYFLVPAILAGAIALEYFIFNRLPLNFIFDVYGSADLENEPEIYAGSLFSFSIYFSPFILVALQIPILYFIAVDTIRPKNFFVLMYPYISLIFLSGIYTVILDYFNDGNTNTISNTVLFILIAIGDTILGILFYFIIKLLVNIFVLPLILASILLGVSIFYISLPVVTALKLRYLRRKGILPPIAVNEEQ